MSTGGSFDRRFFRPRTDTDRSRCGVGPKAGGAVIAPAPALRGGKIGLQWSRGWRTPGRGKLLRKGAAVEDNL